MKSIKLPEFKELKAVSKPGRYYITFNIFWMNCIGQQLFLFSFFFFTISGCKSVAYFHTPNDMLRQYGTIYKEDGTEKNGEVTITFEAGQPAKNFISLSVNGKVEKMYPRDIKGYKIKDKYYVPRYIDLEGNGISYLLFVQRLTGESSKIQLYQFYQRNQGSDANGDDVYSYYISFPTLSKYEVWNASGKYLVPGFNEKMSRIVADCPALALKIQRQNKGYFYAQLTSSNQKKADVLKKIIDDYNECK